ncbi:hypothetical protein C8F04DRAFT_1266630 [Mycena alexandri]|uniref:Uncharacterized protein n=1 Tax=Mycena alexandri TaxID=1745969 RepID=A0AAD6SIL7_9AGAR|nr:hypothetical protein C8F04DRAFT_1266630 [Mycena alexandri]
MSVFDPPTMLEILKASAGAIPAQKKFVEDWKAAVKGRLATWLKSRGDDAQLKIQLQWEANIVQYVDFLHKKTTVHANKKHSTGPPPLPLGIPILGPRFIPPGLHTAKKHDPLTVDPSMLYIRPLNIVHPFYYDISTCPQCDSTDVKWDSWTGAGSRDVHGLRCEEKALGFQLRCNPCKVKYGAGGTDVGARNLEGEKLGFSFATTNSIFWDRVEHWKVPRGIPIFLYRSALTRELFDFIVELRPSTTSGRLADNVQQLHLLEYKQRHLEYLTEYKTRLVPGIGPDKCQLKAFSAPHDPSGYNDKSITDDLITSIFLAFSTRTRIEECGKYLRTLTATCINLDQTFKAAAKASVVDDTKARVKLMKGGILSIVNEINLIISWRFCQSGAAAEIVEQLEGLKARFDFLNIDYPISVTVDNCCTVANKIHSVWAAIKVLLDVYHFIMRYAAGILNGAQNPHRKEVLKDVRDAIIKTSATKDGPAKYWLQAEQEMRLAAAFDKWTARGGVWSAAAQNIHGAQMQHVRKGCLHRENQDLPSDGSRIEGSHKGWNSIQRSHASGLEMQTALSHDFVMRRNIRVALNGKASAPTAFVKSTHGSHHVSLVDHTAMTWNNLLAAPGGSAAASNLHPLPRLPDVQSGEKFGLVRSDHTESFGGLFTIKQEPEEEDEDFIKELNSEEREDLVQELGLDATLFTKPLTSPSTPAPALFIDVDSVEISTIIKPHSNPSTDDSGSAAPTMPNISTERVGKRKATLEPDNSSLAISSGSDEPREAKKIHPLFRRLSVPASSEPNVPASVQPAVSSSLTVEQLTAPLPRSNLFPTLTRSQQLFQSLTGTDPRSLKVHKGAEFFLLMDMRVQSQLKSFEMTPKRWVEFTDAYNLRLKALPVVAGHTFVGKNPRALVEKIGEVESQIISRIAKNDFKSLTSGTEGFWKKHCYAVSFIKAEPGESETPTASTDKPKPTRKAQTCTRCKAVKYPGGAGAPENHRRACCSDGFKPTLSDDTPAAWPQPLGVFSDGTEFHPFAFLTNVRELHSKLVVEAVNPRDLSLEQDAFQGLLQDRMVINPMDGAVMWRMFTAFNVPAADNVPENLFVDYNGVRHLYINSLSDTDLVAATE